MNEYDDPEPDGNGNGTQPVRTPEDRFMNEALVRQSMLCETEIKPYSIDHLKDIDMSMGFINSMTKVVMSAFDNSKILSKLQDGKEGTMSGTESIIRLRLRLNLGKLHYETFDCDSPNALTIPEDILWDYIHYITRAEKGWENELQHKYSVSQESTSTQIIKDQRQGSQPKKKFFGVFG
jgi:hypothetical protein